jgi:hypothetical protein
MSIIFSSIFSAEHDLLCFRRDVAWVHPLHSLVGRGLHLLVLPVVWTRHLSARVWPADDREVSGDRQNTASCASPSPAVRSIG